ncbi:hypothetical protein [Halopiger xanaduensis]|uniref:Uncharacterized protein n=1 Tax=Halopiger xanaduensis (strain DSM 18323 / JCM 14033 / SH-6) TaxID=797210 RepID=F8DEQ3_HALXS|nr:hypothetical protein [Halopiger xanaduensis]AEH39490.1 hypothetical protein Halxa_0250 [Halopiger xanaduensis SH-6]
MSDDHTTVDLEIDVRDAQDLSVLAYQEIADGVAEAVGEPDRAGEFPESVRVQGTLEVVPQSEVSDDGE